MNPMLILDNYADFRPTSEAFSARVARLVGRLNGQVRGYLHQGYRAAADIAPHTVSTAQSVTSETARTTASAKPQTDRSSTSYSETASTNGKNSELRFHRDIVPQLDAAYNFARFLSRDPDAAQDIVQEAFLRAFRSFDGYQGGDARAWIFTIVRNCYYDWLVDRRRKARLEVDVHSNDDEDTSSIDNVPSEDDDPEVALLRSAETSAVRAALNQLPRPLREILILRELEGLSYRQIADVATLPIGTVMSRLARARAHFENVWRQVRFQETRL
jgi:RNA polymerase sigma factor (sigma-70 family)